MKKNMLLIGTFFVVTLNISYSKELAEINDIETIIQAAEVIPNQKNSDIKRATSKNAENDIIKQDQQSAEQATKKSAKRKIPHRIVHEKKAAQPRPVIKAQAQIITSTPIMPKPLVINTSNISAEATAKTSISSPNSTSIKTENCSTNTNLQFNRIVSVKNLITKDMITYKKHWSGHHTPSDFHVKINGIKLANTHTQKSASKNGIDSAIQDIAAADENLNIEVYYKFTAMGITHHEETKKYRCQVPKSTQKLETKFSWDQDSRILIESIENDHRTALTITEIA